MGFSWLAIAYRVSLTAQFTKSRNSNHCPAKSTNGIWLPVTTIWHFYVQWNGLKIIGMVPVERMDWSRSVNHTVMVLFIKPKPGYAVSLTQFLLHGKNAISCEELCPKHSSNRGSKFPDCVNSVIRVLSLGLLYCNFSDINITCPEKMPPLLAVLSWVLCFELGSLFWVYF